MISSRMQYFDLEEWEESIREVKKTAFSLLMLHRGFVKRELKLIHDKAKSFIPALNSNGNLFLFNTWFPVDNNSSLEIILINNAPD